MQNYSPKADMQHSAVHWLPNEFNGSRCEFFQELIVNFLLIFVNFGLHYTLNQACYSHDAEKEAACGPVRMVYFRQAPCSVQATQ